MDVGIGVSFSEEKRGFREWVIKRGCSVLRLMERTIGERWCELLRVFLREGI